MADNMIELVASLNVDDSAEQINKVDIPKLQKKIEGIKIKCKLDTDGISSIQSQLANISKNSKLDIPKVEVQADTRQSGQNIENVAKSVETVTNKVLTLKKTLADLDNRFVEAFKAVKNPDGIINAERTMAVIQSRLSSLGTVTVTGKYNDQESEDSINKIIARIEAASGEVRELNFLLDSTGQKFEYIGGSYSDKGVGKIQQDLARLSKELANFEASHKSIETGLIEPLTTARNAIIDLESGVGSVESAQKALDNLKTVAANIGSNLKSTGSSFNVFDNAANKAKNFDNTIKTLKMDIESLSPSTSKSSLVSQLDLAIERMNEFKDVESKSGRGVEWSQRYGEISSLLQNITNNLKVAQKEENAFNKEFERAVREEEKQLAIEQKRVETARQLRESQQHDYWQGRFEETVKGMTAENQVLKDMKKYYEDLNKAQKEVERQEKKTFQEDNKLANLQNRIKRLTADINSYASANKRAVESTKQMTSGRSFADEWSRITSVMAKGADLTDRELKDLSADMAVFRKEAQAAGLAGASAFEKFGNAFKLVSTYISANQVINMATRNIREAVDELKTVDDRLTEISKTSDRTTESLKNLGLTSFDTASKYGRTASDYLLGVQEMSRAGFAEKASEDMAELSVLAQSAGDMTANLANQYLIATNAAYQYNGSVDKLNDSLDRQNYITNHYALSMSDLAEATKIAASQAAQSGIGIDEMTAALSTMISTTQQGGEIAARSLRGILMNIQQIKGEVGDGEEDITSDSLSKYEKAAAALGVSLKEVRNGAVALRDPMVVLDELATAFNKEADNSIKKANLISAIGGKYRGNQLSALLTNWDTYKDILNTFNSEQAVGSAMAEAEKSANNWAGSLNKVRNSWAELVNQFINSDDAISMLQSADKIIQNLSDSATTGSLQVLSDSLASLIKLISELTDKFGTFPTLLASVGAVGSFNKMGFFKVVEDDATKGGNAITLFGKKFKDIVKDYKEADAGRIGENKISQALSGIIGFNQSDLSAIEKYNSLIESGVDKTEAFEKSMVGASNGAKSFVQSSKTATVGITGLSISEKAATVATEALGVALNTALSFGIGLLIQAIITGITKLVDAEKEAQEKAEELRREATETAKSYKDEVESLSNLTTEYIKLATTTSDLSTQKEKLLGIQDKINDGFASEKEKVDLLNGSLSENLRLLDEQEYKEAKRLGSVDKNEAKEVAKNIEQEFIDFFNATTDYYKAEWVDPSTGESRTAYNNILNTLSHADDLSIAGKSYAEVLDNLDLIIDSYREWEGHNTDTLKSLNALRDKYDELAQSENEVTTAYETAQKSMQDYNDAFNSDASQRISEILEDAKELSTTLNSSTSETEKYNAIQQLSDLEKEARQLAGTNTVLKNNVDVVFNAINTGSQLSIKSIGDLRSAWFESLEDIQKNTISNIDKMDKALKTVVDGNNLSSSDFWELAKLDTDNIIRSISLVNGEYKLSQQELVNLKDQYIQKQIESLEVTQAQIKADEEEARQALIVAKRKLADIGSFDTIKRGSANLNNPAYRAYLDRQKEANSEIEKAENNIKELGDEWARNNVLLREYNSRLGFSVEQTKALAETYKKNFTDAIDKQIDKVNDRKQALEDEKAVLNEQLEVLEEQQKALEETIEQYKTVSNVIKKAIDEETDALKEQQKAEEDAVQARIDALKKSREAKEEETELAEKQLAVQEKLRDLEKARNNKVRTYSSDRGWHYEADKEAVANAETAYSDARKAYDEFIEKRSYESQLKALESEKDLVSKNYEGMIQAYEDYYTEYEKILNEQTDAENEQLANQILGADWRERIKSRDIDTLNKFKANFNSYNSQLKNLVNGEIATLKNSIKAKGEQIKALDKEIDAWNRYKNNLKNSIDEIDSKYEDMQNGLGGLEYANDLSLSNIESRMWDFKENYKAYMDEAISKARELRDASSEGIDTSAIDSLAERIEKIKGEVNDAIDAMSEKSIFFGGKVSASKTRASLIAPQFYDLATTPVISNAINKPNVNETNRVININELTIKADNPKQFHDQFEKEMGQYWKIKLTENYVK